MRSPCSHRLFARRGFTLVETAASTVIVTMVLTAAMNAVVAVSRHRGASNDRARAGILANELLCEVLELPYKEPNGTASFGPESGETSRSLYDDMDDYHNLNESPPKLRDGTTLSGLTGWTRDVTIQQVGSSDPLFSTTIKVGSTTIGVGMSKRSTSSDTGIRRAIVNVRRNGVLQATATGLRTDQ